MKRYRLIVDDLGDIVSVEDPHGMWIKDYEFKEYEADRVGAFNLEDIRCQAANDDVALTDDQVLDVMNYLQHHFDASIGINWDVISLAIREIANRG